jgi:hypothetical protein
MAADEETHEPPLDADHGDVPTDIPPAHAIAVGYPGAEPHDAGVVALEL